MKSEIKTAIALVAIIGGGVGILSISLTALDEQGTIPLDSLEDIDTAELLSVDKSRFEQAPDIVGIAHHINTTPEELEAKIKDSVVLYDIWTYSCINCIRTIPYITAWDQKYADQGLLIIGIHSPEFEFEKDAQNVQRAVDKHGIQYPVVLDNDWETWDAFENRYWPRKFIADHEGYLRYDRIGEGGYKETEQVIQRLLAERAAHMGVQPASAMPLVDLEEFEHTAFRTPELYFGYYFAQNRNNLGSGEGFRPEQSVTYAAPATTDADKFYMIGTWYNGRDGMILQGDEGSILANYNAKEVNIVTAGSATIQVTLDGNPVDASMAGADLDIDSSVLATDEPRLYNVISADSKHAGMLELSVENDDGEGFEIFTFTFG